MDFLGRAKTFVRIVEAGSFSAAGRSLRLSLAAISRQITSLEEELGAKLFARTTRSLHLTDEGKRFLEHARRLVHEADLARASVRRGGAVAGSLVVSASVSLGVLRIVPSLGTLMARHPGLELDLRLEDRAADLVSEGVDVAVRAGLDLPDTTGLVATPLATFARHCVASPAYLKKHGTPKSVGALAEHAVVSGGSRVTWTFREGEGAQSVTIVPKLRIATLVAIRAAVLAGVGIAVLPDFVIRDDLRTEALRAIVPKALLAPVSAHALYRIESRGMPRLDALLEHLRSAVPL